MTNHRMRTGVLLALAGGTVVMTACSHSTTVDSGRRPAAAAASSSTVSSSASASATTAAPATSATSAKSATTASSGGTSAGAAAMKTVAPVPARTLPAVALRSPASYGTGLKARIVSVRRGKVTDTGPGLLAGRPAMTFTLSLSNGSRQTMDLDTVQVTASFGAANTPGAPTNPTKTRPVTGTLAPGATTKGTYAFMLPNTAQRQVRITVWYAQGKPTVAFSGYLR